MCTLVPVKLIVFRSLAYCVVNLFCACFSTHSMYQSQLIVSLHFFADLLFMRARFCGTLYLRGIKYWIFNALSRNSIKSNRGKIYRMGHFFLSIYRYCLLLLFFPHMICFSNRLRGWEIVSGIKLSCSKALRHRHRFRQRSDMGGVLFLSPIIGQSLHIMRIAVRV